MSRHWSNGVRVPTGKILNETYFVQCFYGHHQPCTTLWTRLDGAIQKWPKRSCKLPRHFNGNGGTGISLFICCTRLCVRLHVHFNYIGDGQHKTLVVSFTPSINFVSSPTRCIPNIICPLYTREYFHYFVIVVYDIPVKDPIYCNSYFSRLCDLSTHQQYGTTLAWLWLITDISMEPYVNDTDPIGSFHSSFLSRYTRMKYFQIRLGRRWKTICVYHNSKCQFVHAVANILQKYFQIRLGRRWKTICVYHNSKCKFVYAVANILQKISPHTWLIELSFT